MRISTTVLSIGLTLVLYTGTQAQQPAPAPEKAATVRLEKYRRTELYMGMSIPGGGTVSDEAWEKFLAELVTPMFPEGFSILMGRGQYREASGVIAKEPSHVLVFLYPHASRKDASAKIERIRTEYKRRFSQESVMRVDIVKSVLVGF
jgi:hypothetical protein